MKNYSDEEVKYLSLLAKEFPTIQDVCTEIINLKAILNLPKATEHFLSDLHGEYESFLHILKNASGVIKSKIDELYENSMTHSERKKLATLIYYPEEKLELIKKEEKELKEFYKITLYHLIEVCKMLSSKYSRSKVRKAMPKEYEYIIEELLNTNANESDKEYYYEQIIDSIISLDRADAFIIAISKLIQRLAVDHLHIIGDIYDRGPGPHIIMEKLRKYHSIDIEWGNHDIVWMGAASGSPACILNVIRICARYNNLDILEDGYGINIRTITEFAMEEYPNEKSEEFKPHVAKNTTISEADVDLLTKIQKAVAIMQFKVEAQIIKNHSEYNMEDRLLLDKINYKEGTVKIKNKEYKLKDTYFPTINEENPYELTQREKDVIEKLVRCFKNSEKLQKHIKFLYTRGSLYKIYNENLLIHGCILMNEKGEFKKIKVDNKMLKGKEYFDAIEVIARQGYFADENSEEKQKGMDFLWYLWCGENSPIFCKDSMKTFERYFIDDKETWKEIKNPFYKFAQDEEVCKKILKEFGINENNGHIICGHMPVKFKEGENPIKASGKLLMIDGGLSKSYQETTGIAGYTLIFNSYGLVLAAHEKFSSTEDAIVQETDLYSSVQIVEKVERKRIKDTDIGKQLNEQINDLNKLLQAYQTGILKQKIV